MTTEEIKLLKKFLISSDGSHGTHLAGQFEKHNDPLKISITSYVNHGYRWINGYLRKRQKTVKEEYECIIKFLNLALDTCPPIPNTTLFRMESSCRPNWYVKNWFKKNIGKTIIFPTFTSCSQEYRRVAVYPILFKFYTHQDTNAHNIDDNGGEKCEMESLFKNNTSFKILSANLCREKNKVIIELQEVMENEGIIIYENEKQHLPIKNDDCNYHSSLID